jgi:hypothetical protein
MSYTFIILLTPWLSGIQGPVIFMQMAEVLKMIYNFDKDT